MTPDERLVKLRCPLSPQELLAEIEKSQEEYGQGFVTMPEAKKARDCWVGTKFLLSNPRFMHRSVLITKATGESPDLECFDQLTRQPFSIEATEILCPGRRRNDEYRSRTSGMRDVSGAEIELERRLFPEATAACLAKKLLNDYGVHCILVLYENMQLYGSGPIEHFVHQYRFSVPVRFQEIWIYSSHGLASLYPLRQAWFN